MVHLILLIIHTNDMAVYIHNIFGQELFIVYLNDKQSKSQKIYKYLRLL